MNPLASSLVMMSITSPCNTSGSSGGGHNKELRRRNTLATTIRDHIFLNVFDGFWKKLRYALPGFGIVVLPGRGCPSLSNYAPGLKRQTTRSKDTTRKRYCVSTIQAQCETVVPILGEPPVSLQVHTNEETDESALPLPNCLTTKH